MITTHSAESIAEHLGVSKQSVWKKAWDLGFSVYESKSGRARKPTRLKVAKSIARRRLWTEQEIDYLATHYGVKSTQSIAKYLKRTVHSVRGKAFVIGAVENRRHAAEAMMTVQDVANFLQVPYGTIQTWASKYDLPFTRHAYQDLTHESDVLAWLATDANVLKLGREQIEPRLQRLYDATRAQFYTGQELRDTLVPILQPRQWNYGAVLRTDVPAPTPYNVGRCGHAATGPARLSRTTYYRKSEVWTWVYEFGHLIPDNVKHPDIADIRMAWLSKYIPSAELYRYFRQATVHKWTMRRGFPPQPKHRICYDRLAVVAWCKANGFASIARALYRGVPLCYDEVIRERERRHA